MLFGFFWLNFFPEVNMKFSCDRIWSCRDFKFEISVEFEITVGSDRVSFRRHSARNLLMEVYNIFMSFL